MYTVDNADFLGCLQLSTPTIPCTTAEVRKIRGGRSISLKSSALDLGRKNRDFPRNDGWLMTIIILWGYPGYH